MAAGQGVQAARETKGWDLAARPVLAWSWRPRQFPKGADERDPAKNDSALAVYMLVEHSKVTGPKAVKYIWSERVPVGTHLTSNNGLTQVRVLRSGAPKGEGWTEERANVLEDFQKYFSEKGTPKPAGIAVLTDADDTKSTAAGDYANFRASRPRLRLWDQPLALAAATSPRVGVVRRRREPTVERRRRARALFVAPGRIDARDFHEGTPRWPCPALAQQEVGTRDPTNGPVPE